jgi:ribulose-phosphate 3-epimerase
MALKTWSRIAPSLLSANFAALGTECQKALAWGADWIHVDVMDYHFVPNLTIGFRVIESLRKAVPEAFLDVHLMVEDPESCIAAMSGAGVQQVSFHVESSKDPKALIKAIKTAGMRASIAVNPRTAIEAVFPYLEHLDMVLVMTVEPGFGGQVFMPQMLGKVNKLREKRLDLDIEVDGGVNLNTFRTAADAGANCFVSGAIFQASEPAKMISRMRDGIEDCRRRLWSPPRLRS